MEKVIKFIQKYWGIGKEIILVLAAILYFAISFRVAPLVTRIDALETNGESTRKALDDFVLAADKRISSDEATIKSISDANISNRQDIKNIKETVNRLLDIQLNKK